MSIRTPRLVLRPPQMTDAARIALLAGDYDVASMTGTIPHPYSEQQAGEWIASALAGEEGVVFVVERSGALIGCTGYRAFGPDHAEIGYWIGKPYWGMGYATEAVRALILHAFETDGFDYLTVGHFIDNPASERIIAKFGFVREAEVKRDCAARGAKAHCITYRLEREAAMAGYLRT
ncbi:MAG TPA: GNAT family N-acetyltransferase [Methyloceanibacter sp.]|nr:GNAT family N-acetyltransferase [Methyloceanibacter sp.]